MKPNIGKMDRTIRLIIGITILAVGLSMKSWWGAIGVIPIFTAFINWCPLYAPFGISTISKQKES